MAPKLVPLASLVHDFTMYPRNRVDDSHVSDLLRALQSGHSLPSITACATSLRIVDGFHRLNAYRRFLGDDASVSVHLKHYDSDAELFLDAVAMNSVHGRKLDRHDQTRIVLRLRELNVSDREIAIRLHIPEPQIQHLAIRVVMAPSGPVPSKRGLEHMQGQAMTLRQVAVMESVRSAEAGRLALELYRLLDAGMVDLNDALVVSRLNELHSAISAALKAVAA